MAAPELTTQKSNLETEIQEKKNYYHFYFNLFQKDLPATNQIYCCTNHMSKKYKSVVCANAPLNWKYISMK